ncbi:5-methylcytosine-specific restriction endonuclease McrA [Neobacillus niacini]|uniref:HNH endonuclease n=1 Tax=Neobacillus niacini TaxID=86668 RepID=UPI00278738F7|nr:HNH endonuclease signature motif containing protein [Neobacillus niacini]MDQ0999774.1 5-methylcytosine-specific restriction endonuclease McrA [Neobacillus niacini]
MPIIKTCRKCHQKYEYGTKCSCLSKYRKQMNTVQGKEDNFYISKEWRAVRELVFIEYGIEDGALCCQRCLINERIIVYKNMEGHHLKPRSKYPELELDPDNIVPLCKSCNIELGDSGIVDWDRSKELREKIDYTL